jgi:hypothetical protein
VRATVRSRAAPSIRSGSRRGTRTSARSSATCCACRRS